MAVPVIKSGKHGFSAQVDTGGFLIFVLQHFSMADSKNGIAFHRQMGGC